jgi:hypothetical protein
LVQSNQEVLSWIHHHLDFVVHGHIKRNLSEASFLLTGLGMKLEWKNIVADKSWDMV